MLANALTGLQRSPSALLVGSVFSLLTTVLSVITLTPPNQAGVTASAAIDAFDTGTALAILGGIATIIISLATLVISTRSRVYEQQMVAFTELSKERKDMIEDLRGLLDCANEEVKRLRTVVEGQDEVIQDYQRRLGASQFQKG